MRSVLTLFSLQVGECDSTTDIYQCATPTHPDHAHKYTSCTHTHSHSHSHIELNTHTRSLYLIPTLYSHTKSNYHTHPQLQVYTLHTLTHIYTYSDTHTHKHKHTHTHTHTHTKVQRYLVSSRDQRENDYQSLTKKTNNHQNSPRTVAASDYTTTRQPRTPIEKERKSLTISLVCRMRR